MSLSYQQKLNIIKDITTLGINSKKYHAKNPNFTRTEKWLISRYYNLADQEGYLNYREKGEGFRVKFVKTKKRKEKKGKRFKGYFYQGAGIEDKIVNGKIIKGAYEKTLVELNFGKISRLKEKGLKAAVNRTLKKNADKLSLVDGDYYTIVLQNGWELGQKNRKQQIEPRKDGVKIAEDFEGIKKLEKLTEKIVEQLKQGMDKYQLGTMALVKGIYVWKFRKQRQPNKKELKVISGRKRKN